MKTELRIPQLGIGMTEALLQQWLATDGARVEAGTPIYVLEAEKSVSDIEAPHAGTLRITAAPGATYLVGDLIGHIE